MDAKKILDTIAEISAWKGDVYKLAYVIADAQKEESAALLDREGYHDLAELVRGA